jgi:hypothetical protein
MYGFKTSLLLIMGIIAINSACTDGAEQPGETSAATSSTTSASGSTASSGSESTRSVVFQKDEDAELSERVYLAPLESGKASVRLNIAPKSLNLTDASNGNEIEISILDEAGEEISYQRIAAQDAEITVPDDAAAASILIRDNSSGGIDLAAEEANQLVLPAVSSPDAIHADITLKAFVAFARQCRQLTPDGNSTTVVQAAAGHYFAQPFVFLGKVSSDRRVAPIATAKIAIVLEQQKQELVPISAMDLSHMKQFSSLSQQQHADYMRTFYSGYFGAAGELYTIPTFMKKGDCSAQPQFSLGSDPGIKTVLLSVEDLANEPVISESIPIRVTIQPAFNLYLGDDTKLNDWTQCTLNRRTGEPQTYNGDAATCKELSVSQPPYAKLDWAMPSEAGVTSIESDPTRLIFYGHAWSKEAVDAVIAQSDILTSDPKAMVELQGCTTNGGLVAVPLQDQGAKMPLRELNVQLGDVINMARRSGSYTALTKFYQGNVDMSGSLEIPTCIPGASSACDHFRTVTYVTKSCVIKADSGIAVGSISDSFVYPDYFELSGIITE